MQDTEHPMGTPDTRIHPYYQPAPARHPWEDGTRLGASYAVPMIVWLGGSAVFQYLGHSLIIVMGLGMWIAAAAISFLVREQATAIARRIKMVMLVWMGFLLSYRYAMASLSHLSSAQLGAALGIAVPQASALAGVGWAADMLFVILIGVPIYYFYWLAQTYYAYRGRARVESRLDEQQRRRPVIR